MIEYIKGELTGLTPTDAIVETAGIGYIASISLSTYTALEGQRQVKLLIHEVIREDTHALYGFSDERERELFRLLIGVSGVGANTADLEQVIMQGDYGKLKNVKGIGVKTAQRIIVDLKDKIKVTEETLTIQPSFSSEAYEEALAALLMLGFARPQSQKVLKKLFDKDPALKVERAVKQALAML